MKGANPWFRLSDQYSKFLGKSNIDRHSRLLGIKKNISHILLYLLLRVKAHTSIKTLRLFFTTNILNLFERLQFAFFRRYQGFLRSFTIFAFAIIEIWLGNEGGWLFWVVLLSILFFFLGGENFCCCSRFSISSVLRSNCTYLQTPLPLKVSVLPNQ